MKVIFLDFDGVMTAKNGTPGSYMTHGPEEYGATPECVRRVLKLAEEQGAKIIVSSNWRKFDETGAGSIWTHSIYGDIANPLPKFIPQLGHAYLGKLPPVRGLGKAALITCWLASHGEVKRFVAFDDMCAHEGFRSFEELEGRYVNTDPETGLTDEDCEKAARILSAV